MVLSLVAPQQKNKVDVIVKMNINLMIFMVKVIFRLITKRVPKYKKSIIK
jgi:hypothetical protein